MCKLLQINKDIVNNEGGRAVTVKVPISVFNEDIQAVLDTGAEVTVMSVEYFNSIPKCKRPTINQQNRSLTMADHDLRIETYGILQTKISIGKTNINWPVYVASIKDPILLGCDLFDAYAMIFSSRDGLCLNGEWIKCETIRVPESIVRLVMKGSVTIPSNCELITSGKIQNIEKLGSQYGLVEPIINREDDGQGDSALVLARALISTCAKEIPVRLLNYSNEPVEVFEDSVIGEIEPIDLENLTEFGGFNENHFESMGPHSSCTVHLGSNENTFSTQIRNINLKNVLPPNIPKEFVDTFEDSNPHNKIPAGNVVPEHLRELYEKSCKNVIHDRDKTKLADIFRKHEKTFAKNKQDLGKCSLIKHKINTGTALPIKQPMRRTPKGFEDEEEKYLKEQLEAGVVVASSSAWSSPICLVRKKDGSVRWCVDYRKLNNVTEKDAYPLPRIDTCLDCLASAKIFSTMDLQSGYWQLELAEEDRAKSAFITKYGLYEYTVLPFGLSTAPGTFQRVMEIVLKGLQWKTLLIYLDDIIIFSSDLNEHYQRLEEVLDRIREAGLKLKPSKCHFLEKEVLFLGHIVGQDGMKPNPELTKSVMDWKTPTSTKHVQQFLGLANYYRRFVKNFSQIASPLTQLTKKDVKFIWNDECQQAMDTLKGALCAAPILAYPQPNLRYILDTDASNSGVGAVLSQIQEGVERVICYGSKKLDKAQRNYCVTRKELLAVVTFVNQYRHYLLGQEFTLRTDHSSLRWLCNFKQPEGQLARWLEVLSQYNFQIVHRDGKKHGNADSLSRQHCGNDECDNYKQGEDLASLPCGGCPGCTRKHHQWAKFETEVNNVFPLPWRFSDHTYTDRSGHFIRYVTTRGMEASSSNKDMQNDSHMKEPRSNWLQGYTTSDLIKFQREDKDIGMLHIWKENNTKPDRDEAAGLKPALRKYWLNWDNLVWKEGVLYKMWHFPDERKSPSLQLLVPKVLQREVLTSCHNSLFAAHLGIAKTVSKVKQRFYWYKVGADVELHIKKCPVCCANSHPRRRLKAPLKDYRVGAPMDRIGVDVLGPLPVSNQGNSYILVIGDYFTRWMDAYPMPDQQAETTASKLVNEFISKFGVPLEIHSDQGRNFESQLFQEMCRVLEIKKTRSTPYRPQSNGLIERFNRTLGKMVRSFVDSNKQDWDVHIPLLTAAYRSTVHPSTGFTPNKLMLGREVNLPVDIIFPRKLPPPHEELHEYVAEMRDRMEECFELARECLSRTAERQKRDYDTRACENMYGLGQLVYKRSPVRKKLELPWEGPYLVLSSLGSSLYRVTNKKKALILHHDLLKPYTSEFVPKWAKKLRKQVNSKLVSEISSNRATANNS